MAEESAPLSQQPTSRWGCGWMVKYVNLTATAALSVVVGFMFMQLQVLTFQLNQNKKTIAALSEQVNTQQKDQIETLNEKVEQNQSLTILQMAGTFVLLTCLLTMFHMSSHLRNYHEPVIQRKVIAVLWMSPIYGLTSFLSLIVPAVEGYLAVVKDFYEAYVIYTFLSFLIAVLGRGDRNVAVEVLAKHADHLKSPTNCFRRCYYPPPEESPLAKASAVLMECQILAMQFVFCRPLTSIASFVVTTVMAEPDIPNNSTDDAAAQVTRYFSSPQFWISMVTNISVFLAFTGLLKLYHAVRDDLAWIQPFSKFLCIKGVVFLSFWQGLVINIAVSLHEGGRWEDSSDDDPREKAMAIQNILICLEMLFFSIAHWCAFPADEWKEGYRPKETPAPGIGLSDFVSDVSIIVKSSRQAKEQRRIQKGQYVKAGGIDTEMGPDDVESSGLEDAELI